MSMKLDFAAAASAAAPGNAAPGNAAPGNAAPGNASPDDTEGAPPISGVTRAAPDKESDKESDQEPPPVAAVMKRIVVRLDPADIVALDHLRKRCAREALRRVSRADVIRLFVHQQSDALDPDRPLCEQLPFQALAGPRRRRAGRRPTQSGPSLRSRIVQVLEARPGEVFTPATLAPLVGAPNRDVVRNTLLVLGAKGRVEKIGPGRYRGLPAEPPQVE